MKLGHTARFHLDNTAHTASSRDSIKLPTQADQPVRRPRTRQLSPAKNTRAHSEQPQLTSIAATTTATLSSARPMAEMVELAMSNAM